MMMEGDSDGEDDRHRLIERPQEEVRKIQRSNFEIGEEVRRVPRFRPFRTINKWYLVAIFVPVILVVVFFSLGSSKLVGDFPSLSFKSAPYSAADRMRESELKALYLLRQQKLGFARLWNLTSVNSLASNASHLSSSNSTANVSDSAKSKVHEPSILMDDLRSELLSQIRINEEIQHTLLSSHVSGNESEFLEYASPDFDVNGGNMINRCRKVDYPANLKTIEWKPDPKKFLLAICISGQMSNHLICLEKHMFFAALLGRTLVFPSSKIDYQYERVLDINHINDCFGGKVVLTFEEFAEKRKGRLHIDRFICYISNPPCYMDEDHIKKLERVGISMGKPTAAWPKDSEENRRADDIVGKFSCADEVLAVGDLFYAKVEEEWVMQTGGPIKHKCKSVIQPNRLIILTAQRFIQTFLGENFIALHFRRHGFLKFCNAKKESCFFPIPQAAKCILQNVEKTNAPVIYLSTDAAESETNLLQSLIVLDGNVVPLVKRPSHTSVEKWDALLYRNHLGSDDQVEAMLDKTICAMSSVFIGASGSTFTEDILRLRKDWRSASVCDEYLCQGRRPNFIADLE
ncbi:O-fucosyltransferase 36-like [Nymphaea colorata]|nr:O-fucosyltransferase 36-like [Nymphaea colorata]XP_031498407.1 O-fucosyltransferase 36-like [Nymphaea colorata]XP_049935992.1 O-fucosyltransferase 36-like [Nymphaea colorata]